nr:unnamed protein product [Digitaria exilis]
MRQASSSGSGGVVDEVVEAVGDEVVEAATLVKRRPRESDHLESWLRDGSEGAPRADEPLLRELLCVLVEVVDSGADVAAAAADCGERFSHPAQCEIHAAGHLDLPQVHHLPQVLDLLYVRLPWSGACTVLNVAQGVDLDDPEFLGGGGGGGGCPGRPDSKLGRERWRAEAEGD